MDDGMDLCLSSAHKITVFPGTNTETDADVYKHTHTRVLTHTHTPKHLHAHSRYYIGLYGPKTNTR